MLFYDIASAAVATVHNGKVHSKCRIFGYSLLDRQEETENYSYIRHKVMSSKYVTINGQKVKKIAMAVEWWCIIFKVMQES